MTATVQRASCTKYASWEAAGSPRMAQGIRHGLGSSLLICKGRLAGQGVGGREGKEGRDVCGLEGASIQ